MTKKMTSATNRYFESLNHISREEFLACFTEDASVHDPYGGRPFVGAEELNKWFDGFERTWSEFSIVGEVSYSGGDRFAVKWAASGTAKTGKSADFEGIDLFAITGDGLIARMDGYWDALSMLAQIR